MPENMPQIPRHDAPDGKFGRGKEYAVKKWKPIHDKIVALHLAGYKNVNIAPLVGCQPEHVSDVLNDPRAQKAIRELEERMFDKFGRRIQRKMTALGDEAVDNLAQTITADLSESSPGSKAKKHQDDVSFDLLDRIGYGKKQASRGQDGDGAQIDERVGERLVDALEQAEVAQNPDEIEMAQDPETGEFKAVQNGDGGSDED